MAPSLLRRNERPPGPQRVAGCGHARIGVLFTPISSVLTTAVILPR